MPLTPQQRSQRASIAINTRWSKEDPAANAIRGQRGLRARFIREAFEADPGITDAEAERRGESAFKAHMVRLAFASSKARSRKAGGSDAT